MPKLPIISAKKAVKFFEQNGYRVTRQRGSHIRLHHPIKQPLTIPNHKTIARGLLRKLLRDSEISVDELVQGL
ncbi:type II toxin-antitoxin system HicA family toxin [Patescibacteria group bacterium]|nr:type II toxin-antitoxin system HicA family toxin [Patescibacteria group bacterium]